MDGREIVCVERERDVYVPFNSRLLLCFTEEGRVTSNKIENKMKDDGENEAGCQQRRKKEI